MDGSGSGCSVFNGVLSECDDACTGGSYAITPPHRKADR